MNALVPIQANCRDRLNVQDFEFIANSLAAKPEASARFADLFSDPCARDAALESEKLLRALLEKPEPVSVSPRLYFYVLTRHSLGGFDREIADYIASVLAAFLDVRRLRAVLGKPELRTDYLTDMLAALTGVSSERAFLMRAHVGNYSLFVAGIFPEHIRHKATLRGAPDISFYEEVGSTNYRLASDHDLARRHDLSDVYRIIADQFSDVRRGLNRLSDQLLCIEPTWNPSS